MPKVHESLRATPAMAADLTDRPRCLEEVVAPLEPARRR